jgi:predicted phosphodiesterase
MKIALCSDLHLEFADIDLKNTDNADVLILSGDICVARELPFVDSDRGERFRQFFKRCSLEFPHVIYVMGNHEHYHGDYQASANLIRAEISKYDNFYFLDKESKEINDVVFIGGTLWTDMNKEDPITLWDIGRMMNDFRVVYNSARTVGMSSAAAKFLPDDAVIDHKAMLEFIDNTLKETPPWKSVVVVGHHAPSKLSTKPQYQDDVIMNGGYSSDLAEFITNRPQIKLWTHGHTHDEFDYIVGSTRVLCNPRGYGGYEEQADKFELKFVEV